MDHASNQKVPSFSMQMRPSVCSTFGLDCRGRDTTLHTQWVYSKKSVCVTVCVHVSVSGPESDLDRNRTLDPGGGGGGTCLIFVRGCANAVSETRPFLLQFFLKRHHFSCNFWMKNMLFSLHSYSESPTPSPAWLWVYWSNFSGT